MSHDTHATHASHDGEGPPAYLRDRGGFAMPYGALLFVLFAIIVSTIQGSLVIGFSPWGHVWPAANSPTLQLPPAHLTP
jgi:hypothetical protein